MVKVLVEFALMVKMKDLKRNFAKNCTETFVEKLELYLDELYVFLLLLLSLKLSC